MKIEPANGNDHFSEKIESLRISSSIIIHVACECDNKFQGEGFIIFSYPITKLSFALFLLKIWHKSNNYAQALPNI